MRSTNCRVHVNILRLGNDCVTLYIYGKMESDRWSDIERQIKIESDIEKWRK